MRYPIFERAAENVISWMPRGSVHMQLTGNRIGLSYHDWERLFQADLAEWTFDTPRCLRFRGASVDERLAQLNSLC